MTNYETIITETHEHVGLIRLNRPKAYNALNSTLLKELMDALEYFDHSDSIGVMVITGNEKVFAAGADIKQMTDASAVEMLHSEFIPAFDRIRKIKKPIIAAVSGWVLGGGNELAMSCDMIIASETAKFGQPEINLGIIPGAGGTQRLTKAVGKAIAMEMVLNNRTLSADEALHYGLINRVVPVERYLEEALDLASEVASRAPLAIQLGKESVNHAFESFLEDGLKDERRSFYFLFATEDQKEGMKAFNDKRKPLWKGK
ncbi:MAG: enoyl-CoA hydratase/isomerase family protein [Anaerolineales bacterium]|nr:enoyl-CoA hydratase/isomerase family protein [Anaerolineales bacterium]HEY61996.1 enoyl-CoA hydratase [Anaerolineae bacterium]